MAGWAAEASGDRQEAQRFAGGEEEETCRALGSRLHDHGVLCLPQTSKVVVPVPTSRWRNRGLEDAWGPSRKRLKPGPKPGPAGLHCPCSSRHGGIHRPPVYSRAQCLGPSGSWPLPQARASTSTHVAAAEAATAARPRPLPASPLPGVGSSGPPTNAHPLTPRSPLLGPAGVRGRETYSLVRRLWRPSHWPQPTPAGPSAWESSEHRPQQSGRRRGHRARRRETVTAGTGRRGPVAAEAVGTLQGQAAFEALGGPWNWRAFQVVLEVMRGAHLTSLLLGSSLQAGRGVPPWVVGSQSKPVTPPAGVTEPEVRLLQDRKQATLGRSDRPPPQVWEEGG